MANAIERRAQQGRPVQTSTRTPRSKSKAALPLALAIGLAAMFGASDANAVGNPLLQNVMKALNGYVAAGNMPATTEILNLVANVGPDEYARWRSIAEKGRAAAAAGDGAQLKAACTACHEQYREAYRHKYGSSRPMGN
jgi:hypothetical protein